MFNQKSTHMNPTSEEIKACAEKLHQAQKENYPWCFIEDDIVEQYVKQKWNRKDCLTADCLYDYALSQGLCEVEE